MGRIGNFSVNLVGVAMPNIKSFEEPKSPFEIGMRVAVNSKYFRGDSILLKRSVDGKGTDLALIQTPLGPLWVLLSDLEIPKSEYDRGYTAGFEAGLKARMPSWLEVATALREKHDCKDRDGRLLGIGAKDAYDWLAESMRKGDA